MGRLDRLAAILIVVLAIVGHLAREGLSIPDGDRSPRRPTPEHFDGPLWHGETEAFDQAAEPSKRAPGAALPIAREGVIEIEPRTSSGTGTAFTIGDGVWLTARHVIEGCSKSGVQVDRKKAMRVDRSLHHPNADVSLIFTASAPDAFAVGSSEAAADGYHIGFPQGRPGAVHGERLGTTRLRYTGAYRARERVAVWSEVSRFPSGSGSLGGMSGGPVFDDRGRVIGVVLAEARRRGRTFTATPATIADMLAMAGDDAARRGDPAPSSTSRTYGETAQTLIRSLRVARVLCMAP